MEFCENGDLSEFLSSSRFSEESYPLRSKIRVLSEVIDSMEYLHDRQIIHRDLKLENVLMDINETCKVMDFGLSTIVERMSRAKTTRIGTNLYMAPEVLKDNNYTEKCDVFSFSVFIYILLTEIWDPYGIEFENIHIEVQVSANPNFRPPMEPFEAIIPEELYWVRDIMKKCWSDRPGDRPSFSVLRSSFDQKMKDFSDEIKYLANSSTLSTSDLGCIAQVEYNEEYYEEKVRRVERELVTLSKQLIEKRKKKLSQSKRKKIKELNVKKRQSRKYSMLKDDSILHEKLME